MGRLITNPNSGLWLSSVQWEQMHADVNHRAPEEACGLLAGQGNQTFQVIPVTNELHSSVQFRMEPVEQLRAFQQIEELGLELLGIYHSHPHGPDEPSFTDIAQAYYPDVIHLIWSRESGEWTCKGFRIQNGSIKEVSLFLLMPE